MNIQEKAAWAKRLRADEAFQFFIAEIREDAVSAFVNSARDDSGAREQAHEILRAIEQIEAHLQAAESAQALAEKKGRHRG